ncbi:MAG: hypothetical protein PF693_00745 [Spirochaetia bacterium]|nr:hypothetical protein [Spirochaetia bacterium]
MIDTICLMLKEETQINIEHINAVKRTHDWDNLIPLDAKKYKYSINNYLSIGSSPFGIFLTIQLPIVFHSDNRYSLNQEEAYNSFKKIEDEMRPYILNSGDFTIFELQLTRVDLFKDIEPEYSYIFYEEPLKLLKGFKMDRKLHKNTILFKTKREEITVYDKKEQLLKVKKINLPDIESLMRVEVRLKTKLSIQKHLDIITVQDLLENWHELDRLYNKYLDYRVFRKNDFRGQNTISLPNKDCKTMTHNQIKNKLYYQEMNRVCGLDIAKAEEYLTNEGYARESVRKKLKEFQEYCGGTVNVSTEVKIIDLINELRDKLKEGNSSKLTN